MGLICESEPTLVPPLLLQDMGKHDMAVVVVVVEVEGMWICVSEVEEAVDPHRCCQVAVLAGAGVGVGVYIKGLGQGGRRVVTIEEIAGTEREVYGVCLGGRVVEAMLLLRVAENEPT